ncbi:MAG: hypothetical protein RLZZ338_3911, partial [Cyanobacteriota bacterium]
MERQERDRAPSLPHSHLSPDYYTMTAITLNLNPIIKLNPEQFYQLCQENPDLK